MGSSLADQVTSRLDRAPRLAARAGVDALVVTPGPDLQYLAGVVKHSHERLSALVLPTEDEAAFVVPRLERPGLDGTGVDQAGIRVLDWVDGEDPHGLVAACLDGAKRVAVASDMPALHVLGLRDALPLATQELATGVLRELRMRKDPAEVEYLRRAGAAIDAVHAQVPGWLRAGRTEAEVGADITAAIVAAGHAEAAFVIVGSGPNGASPHHELSERVIESGDVVVVDIGGTMPSGYCSDCTRVYALGHVPDEFAAYYEVLKRAQEAATLSVRPGVSAESVDATAREIIAEAGYGKWFIHRTGHGIGLESHEDPYIVEGNTIPLDLGMAFSIEPGIYPGPHGARIEDIVVCAEPSVAGTGVLRMNNAPHDLMVV